MNDLRSWLSVSLSAIQLLVILWSALKFISKTQQEWQRNENRIATLEANVAQLQSDTKLLNGLVVKLDGISSEIMQLRNRLDGFLDNRKP